MTGVRAESCRYGGRDRTQPLGGGGGKGGTAWAWWLVSASLILGLESASFALATNEQVVVRGTLTYDIHPEVPDRWARQSFFFRATVSGESVHFHTATEDGRKYHECAFVDSTTYTVFGGRVAERELVAAEVDYRSFPRDDGSMINYLWLAYGSGSYFEERTTNRLHPIWSLDDPYLARQGFTVDASWERYPEGRLPLKVLYYNDGYARTRSGVRKWPPPFDQGFTNAIYEVTASTNVLGRWMPLSFRFMRYGVEPTVYSSNRLAIITAVEVRVTEIGWQGTGGVLRPAFRGIADVTDRRFEKSNPSLPMLMYKATNGAWLGVNSGGSGGAQTLYEKELRLRKRVEDAARRSSESQAGRRATVRVMMGFASILALFWVVKVFLSKCATAR